jgi:CDP-diacylglycerol---serine O-phosphatidyltransferase
VVLFFALLISYPWVVLTIGSVCYLASLPWGWLSYRRHEQRDAAESAMQADADAPASIARQGGAPPLPPIDHEPPAERPTRLN